MVWSLSILTYHEGYVKEMLCQHYLNHTSRTSGRSYQTKSLYQRYRYNKWYYKWWTKIGQSVDDAIMFLWNSEYIKPCLYIISEYEKVSGAKLKQNKGLSILTTECWEMWRNRASPRSRGSIRGASGKRLSKSGNVGKFDR